MYTLQSTSDVLKQSSLSSFLSIWLIFSDRNYMLCLIDYNFNWCWHHALHLKKKTFPIFENLLKTLDTATKVLSRLKIPQTRRRVDRLASCEAWLNLYINKTYQWIKKARTNKISTDITNFFLLSFLSCIDHLIYYYFTVFFNLADLDRQLMC